MSQPIPEKTVAPNPLPKNILPSSAMIREQGDQKALSVFKTAVESVPAYKAYLQKHNVSPEQITNIDSFKNIVPTMDKKTYLNKYPLKDLCLEGEITNKFIIERSSGYSGESYYWPSFYGQGNALTTNLENMAIKNGWFSKDKSTLVIINLGFGLWLAGIKVACAYREMANKGNYKITVACPGIEVEDTVRLIKDVGHYYDNIFFVGYPPLVKTVIDEGIRQKLDWPKYNVSMMVGGEGHSENWRDYVASVLGFSAEGRNLERIISVFAAADIGTVGAFETAVSVLVRRLARDNKELAQDLFGVSDRLPQVFQYAPPSNYLEVVNGELLFTAMAGIPVVRYNLHDSGGIILFETMLQKCAKFGYDLQAMLQSFGFAFESLPPLDFCYVLGRSDGTKTLYGVNIYVENIKEALAKKELGNLLSGAFTMENIYDNEQNQALQLTLELVKNIQPTKQVKEKVSQIILEELCSKNSEYLKLYQGRGEQVLPKIELVAKLAQKTLKNKYT